MQIQRPFNLNKAYGVEIELTYPTLIGNRMDLAQKIRDISNVAELGYEVRPAGYSGSNGDYFKITTDCSVSANRSGYIGNTELVTPPLTGKNGMEALSRICYALNELDCQVNKTCGLHVHHDVRDLVEGLQSHDARIRTATRKQLANLIRLVSRWEPMIYGLQPPSRRPGKFRGYDSLDDVNKFVANPYEYKWAVSISDKKWGGNQYMQNLKMMSSEYRTNWATGTFGDDERNLQTTNRKHCQMLKDDYLRPAPFRSYGRTRMQNDRYCGLNFGKFWFQGSVEFRYGGGTLNFEKIKNWAITSQHFVQTIRDRCADFNNLSAELDFSNHGKSMGWMKRNLGMVIDNSETGCELTNGASKWLNKRWNQIPANEHWMQNATNYRA